MEWIKIDAGNARYVGEFMNDFKPGVWNKKITDTGGSHLILTNNINYVIVVPNVDLVKSLIKDGGDNKVFGVYGGIYEQQYINFCKVFGTPKKIVTTWDSLYKVVNWIKPEEYQICVDEYHLVFESIGFRLKAINKMMGLINSFKNARFLSATPNQEQFEFEVLKNLPHYEIEWNRIEKVSPIMHKSNNVVVSTCMFINKLLDGELEAPDINGNITKVKELYIFLNSVKTIEQICRTLELDSFDVKICCSDRKRNRYLLNEYPIEEVTSPNKKINFFTSKCFQGCNLYTNNGLVLMVADTIQPSLMIDMSTQGAQIVGRIRNSQTHQNCFRNTVIYIYRTNNKLTPESLQATYEENIRKSEDVINDFKNISSDTTKQILEEAQDKYLYVIEDGEIYISEDKKNYAKYQNYLRTTYRSDFTIMASFNKDKFNSVLERTWTKWTDETCKSLSKIKMVTYKDVVTDYFNTKDKEWLDEYPELLDIVNYLTLKECNSLHFVKDKMLSRVRDKKQISTIIIKNFKFNTFYTLKEIKEILTEEFKKRDITITPKASILEECEYIEVKKEAVRTDKKVNQGYILKPKFRIK